MPTISVENYLKALYHLQGTPGNRVSTSDLATHLQLTLPSTTGMLKSLSEQGWVDYAPYRGAVLTDAGRRHALRVIRNHRLIEAFLVHTLGYSWDEVHNEAEALEHAISDSLADRIDAFLGHPEFDPHGDPIPRGEGYVEQVSGVCLLDEPVALGRYTVRRVTNQDPEMLRYLQELGIVPGAAIEIRAVLPFDGPLMVVTANKTEIAISRTLIRNVLVQPEPRQRELRDSL
jgi:DtxR family Mn-dependent transcriptional regulator